MHYETTVPTVRDRVAQMATLLILEPIFEADFRGLLLWVPPRALGASSAGGNPRTSESGLSSGVRRGLERVLRFDTAGQADGMSADASGGPERAETDPDVAGNPSRRAGRRWWRAGQVEPLETGNAAGRSDIAACWRICTCIGSTSCFIEPMDRPSGRMPNWYAMPTTLSCWRAIKVHVCKAGSKRRSRSG